MSDHEETTCGGCVVMALVLVVTTGIVVGRRVKEWLRL